MNGLQVIPKELVCKYAVKNAWLRHESRLHGAPHMARVFILQELICQYLQKEGIKFNQQATRWAASVHDVGRVDDGDDLEHGTRSAEWMKAHIPTGMTPETADTAMYIVHWHVPEDSEAPVMTTELKILKDADGLDRVRLGDLNTSYLRTSAAPKLVEIAEKLYRGSLPKHPDEEESFESVLAAATSLGLVK